MFKYGLVRPAAARVRGQTIVLTGFSGLRVNLPHAPPTQNRNPGKIYHVVSRGDRREGNFSWSTADRHFFQLAVRCASFILLFNPNSALILEQLGERAASWLTRFPNPGPLFTPAATNRRRVSPVSSRLPNCPNRTDEPCTRTHTHAPL